MSIYDTTNEHLQDMLVAYVYDNVATGNTRFKKQTDEIIQTFESKPRKHSPFLLRRNKHQQNLNGLLFKKNNYTSKI